MDYGKLEIYLNQKRQIDMVKAYTVMVKVYTIWAAYLRYGSIMKCVMLDDHLAEIERIKKENQIAQDALEETTDD